MELKRILARDTRSATEKAMALFGPDVLIISNHRVEGQTELIVALDVAEASLDEMLETDAEEQSQESNSVTVTAKGPRQRLSSTPSSVSNPFSDHLHQLLQPASRMAQQAEAEPIAHVSTEHLLTQGREQVRSQEIVSLVREELAALRQEFLSLIHI